MSIGLDSIAVDLVLRWLHFAGGIVWIGHNYASMVQRPNWIPFTAADFTDAASPRAQAVSRREHGTFRYASIVTWVAGMLLAWRHGWLPDALLLRGALAPIGIGLYLGTIMLANLWLVLWPHQKKVLGFVAASIEERVRGARITHLSSRANSMLSIPLLFCMAASRYGAFFAAGA